MKIEVKEINHGSEDYKSEVELRTKVLREPLGLVFSKEDLAKERTDIHLGAFQGKKVVGCLLLSPFKKSVIKMKQVAVDPTIQGAGIGKLLVEASEQKAKESGATEIQLNARETAIPFYLKRGYVVFGEPFVEVGIPHVHMRKKLR